MMDVLRKRIDGLHLTILKEPFLVTMPRGSGGVDNATLGNVDGDLAFSSLATIGNIHPEQGIGPMLWLTSNNAKAESLRVLLQKKRQSRFARRRVCAPARRKEKNSIKCTDSP